MTIVLKLKPKSTPPMLPAPSVTGAMDCAVVVAVVSDGPMRDVAEIRPIGLPIFCTGAVAPPSIARLTFAGWQEPVGCGGVAVMPGDVIVADGDGAVVVPKDRVSEIAARLEEVAALEAEMHAKVATGEIRSLLDRYPELEEQIAYVD